MESTPTKVHYGIVKQVLSGDSVIIRGKPCGGPPKEKTVCLAGILTGKLARRPNAPNSDGTLSVDEPFAWEAREFLRKKVIGKEVSFTLKDFKTGTREYGAIYLGKDIETAENLTESLIKEGFASVRHGNKDETFEKLSELEQIPRAANVGLWCPPEQLHQYVRNIQWTIENPRNFVDSFHYKPVTAVIEHVRDACTVRAFLLPDFQYVTIMLSGIKGPMFKMDQDKNVNPDQYAEEAKYFTESRLLQREVEVVLEGVSNQNLLGTVLHPSGNIAEALLREGFARCVDWSMGVVTTGADKLRAAEKFAKDKRIRLWKDYSAKSSAVEIKDKTFTAKVIEVLNGDGMVLKMADGSSKKIFLSSIRSPRTVDTASRDNKDSPFSAIEKSKPADKKIGRSRPLYDIPYMLDAREFLRKKMIGKKVDVIVDYIQPKSDEFPEKICCTVTTGGINVSEALISKGLASCLRYRQDDDQRSAVYDTLLTAEARAQKKAVGIHSKKHPPITRVTDTSSDIQKSKQFLPFYIRSGRIEGIIEFISSGSRFRIYIPGDKLLITLLLSGISCPRASRLDTGAGGEEFGDEALGFVKELIMQKVVQIEIDGMDKGGSFIGFVFFEGTNISAALVKQGLSRMHFSAERTKYYGHLCVAEEFAKSHKLKIYEKEEIPKVVETHVVSNVTESTERKLTYKTVCVTEVTPELHFFAQSIEQGEKFEKMMSQLQDDIKESPPLKGAYTPKNRDLCIAQFDDGLWYRAKVEIVISNTEAKLFYIDYGNKAVCNITNMASIPSSYTQMPAQATEYALAGIALPPEEEDIVAAMSSLSTDILNRECKLNVEYRTTLDCVTLLENGVSYFARQMDHVFFPNRPRYKTITSPYLLDGIVCLEQRKEKRLSKLMKTYNSAESKAKKSRTGIWCYGDFRAEDTREFGYNP